MFEGAFGSLNAVADTLVKATPLLLVAVGICIAFRGGMLNIGGEGQLIVGALAATATILFAPSLPSWALIPLGLGLGFLAGAIWGAVPGLLKARLRVNEILTTIMINAIAVQPLNFLLRGPMMDPDQVLAGSFIHRRRASPSPPTCPASSRPACTPGSCWRSSWPCLDETEITAWEPDRRLARGLAYIPEKRMRDGVIRELSVEENLILEDHARPPFARGIFLNFPRISQHVDRLVAEFEIKTPSRVTPLRNLSGGNLQKLILARELAKRPSVLVAAQPTPGVDIGSTEYIHRGLIEQRAAGTATLLISEDLDEVRNLSDRLAVLYEGRLMGILEREQASLERLGLMMAGVPLAEAPAAQA